ncbi:unnamed protein product [Prunus brigantina]
MVSKWLIVDIRQLWNFNLRQPLCLPLGLPLLHLKSYGNICGSFHPKCNTFYGVWPAMLFLPVKCSIGGKFPKTTFFFIEFAKLKLLSMPFTIVRSNSGLCGVGVVVRNSYGSLCGAIAMRASSLFSVMAVVCS